MPSISTSLSYWSHPTTDFGRKQQRQYSYYDVRKLRGGGGDDDDGGGENSQQSTDVSPSSSSSLLGTEDELTTTTITGEHDDLLLDDADLDEYIEFLLAYADDRATEDDNPLFQKYHRRDRHEEEVVETELSSSSSSSSSSSLFGPNTIANNQETVDDIDVLGSHVTTLSPDHDLLDNHDDRGWDQDLADVGDESLDVQSTSRLDEQLHDNDELSIIIMQDKDETGMVEQEKEQIIFEDEMDDSIQPQIIYDVRLQEDRIVEESVVEDVTVAVEEEPLLVDDIVLDVPLVDDINDEEQLDVMIESLVATVKDDDLEDTNEVTNDSVSIDLDAAKVDVTTTAIEVSSEELSIPAFGSEDEKEEDGGTGHALDDWIPEVDDPMVEEGDFVLESSAVDTMTVPPAAVHEGDVDFVTQSEDASKLDDLDAIVLPEEALPSEGFNDVVMAEELDEGSPDTQEKATPVEEELEEVIPSDDVIVTPAERTKSTFFGTLLRMFHGERDETSVSVFVDTIPVDEGNDDDRSDTTSEIHVHHEHVVEVAFHAESSRPESLLTGTTDEIVLEDALADKEDIPDHVPIASTSTMDLEMDDPPQERYILSLDPEIITTGTYTDDIDVTTTNETPTERNVDGEESNKSFVRSMKEISLNFMSSTVDRNKRVLNYFTGGWLGRMKGTSRIESEKMSHPINDDGDESRESENLKAHSKIYEKYFANQHSVVSASPPGTESVDRIDNEIRPTTDLRSNEKSIFKRPWGMLMDYLTSDRAASVNVVEQEGYTSIPDLEEKIEEGIPDDKSVEDQEAKRPEQGIDSDTIDEAPNEAVIVNAELSLPSSEERDEQSGESFENDFVTDSIQVSERYKGLDNTIPLDETEEATVESTEVVEEDESDYPEHSEAFEFAAVSAGNAAILEDVPFEMEMDETPGLDLESSEDWENGIELEVGANHDAENELRSAEETDDEGETMENIQLQVSELLEVVEAEDALDSDETLDSVEAEGRTATTTFGLDDSDTISGNSIVFPSDPGGEEKSEVEENDDVDVSEEDNEYIQIHSQDVQDLTESQIEDTNVEQIQEVVLQDQDMGNEALIDESDILPVREDYISTNDDDLFDDNESSGSSVGELVMEETLFQEPATLDGEVGVAVEAADFGIEDPTHRQENDDDSFDEDTEDTVLAFVEASVGDEEEEAEDVGDEEDDYEVENDKLYRDVLTQGDSSAMSYKEDLESQNFLVGFMMTRGMEQWVMTSYVLIAWFRIYILVPLLESLAMILDASRKSHVLPKWVNIRGGALSLPENDSDQNGPLVEECETDPKGISAGSKSTNNEADSLVTVKEDISKIAGSPQPHATTNVTPKVRPNRLYRYLLSYGPMGHILIMECVVAVEWFKVYTPFVPSLFGYLLYNVLKMDKESNGGSREPFLSRTSAFLNVDGSAVRGGRKRKAQTRKDDQQALNQLRKLGDVNQARYHLLSQSFMRRHGLGRYARMRLDDEALHAEVDEAAGMVQRHPRYSVAEEIEAESDAEWIVDALTHADKAPDDNSSPLDTTIGVSFGSEGPKLSVGVGLSIGGSRKRSKSMSAVSASISEVARRRTGTSTKKRLVAGPRVSDRDGGVMGRLRAAGANSLMGRSILGAYPGDLPPPQEAADARGLAHLAERYGYGDWSDNEDDSDDDDDYLITERRDDIHDESGDNDTTQFDLESTDKDKPVVARRRRRRKASVSKTQSPVKRKSGSSLSTASGLKSISGSRTTSISGSRKSRKVPSKTSSEATSTPADVAESMKINRELKTSTEKLVPVSMSSSTTASSATSSSSRQDEVPRFKKTNNVRPAMSLLNEVVNDKSKATTTSAKQMLKDYQEKRKKASPASKRTKDDSKK